MDIFVLIVLIIGLILYLGLLFTIIFLIFKIADLFKGDNKHGKKD